MLCRAAALPCGSRRQVCNSVLEPALPRQPHDLRRLAAGRPPPGISTGFWRRELFTAKQRITRGMKSGAFLAIMSWLLWCAAASRFLPPSLSNQVLASHPGQLSRASGIVHHFVSRTNEAAAHPNFGEVLDVRFPSLTRESFHRLQRAYGGWSPGSRSRVKYNSSRRDYSILDFLPPAMQACHGHLFEPEVGANSSVHLHYQCYGHALDVLRLAKRPPWRFSRWLRRRVGHDERLTLSCPDSRDAWTAIRAHTTLVASGFNASGGWAAEADLRPGDVVLVFHDNTGRYKPGSVWLDHCAIWLDRTLLYEKSGSGATTPFRLVDTATFGKSWDTPSGVFRAEVRRPKRRWSWLRPCDLSLRGRYAGGGGGSGDWGGDGDNAESGGGGGGRQSFAVHDLGELCGSADPTPGKVTFSRRRPSTSLLTLTAPPAEPGCLPRRLHRCCGYRAASPAAVAGGYAGVNAAAASRNPRHGWCASPRRRRKRRQCQSSRLQQRQAAPAACAAAPSSTRIGRRGE